MTRHPCLVFVPTRSREYRDSGSHGPGGRRPSPGPVGPSRVSESCQSRCLPSKREHRDSGSFVATVTAARSQRRHSGAHGAEPVTVISSCLSLDAHHDEAPSSGRRQFITNRTSHAKQQGPWQEAGREREKERERVSDSERDTEREGRKRREGFNGRQRRDLPSRRSRRSRSCIRFLPLLYNKLQGLPDI